jgi:hypothetical protein
MAPASESESAESPYQPGDKFDIRRHTPPLPFGIPYETKNNVRTPVRGLAVDDGSGRNSVDHLDFVISNPPLEGAPVDTKQARPPRALTIVQKLSHKPKRTGGGTVVVSCHLDGDQSTQCVAKIYDGFEYELVQPGSSGLDCMYRADMDYSREAAAYESIPARFQGSIAPRYFGSWTFPLSTNVPGRPRWVRMVLVEHIDGECMLDMMLHARGATRSNPEPKLEWPDEVPRIDYRLLPPEEERLDILARIVEAETMLWWYGGVKHSDVAPRNVIISRPASSNASSRVTLIDFNAAYVLHRYDRGRETIKRLGLGKGLPTSPIQRYWPATDFVYGSDYSWWIPERWRVEDDEGNRDASYVFAVKWLIGRWRASPKFQPPSDDFLNCPYHQEKDEPFPQLINELKSFLAERRRQASGQQKGQSGAGKR